MVLASKNFFGALRIDLELDIWKNGSLKSGNLDFWSQMTREGSEDFFTSQNHIWAPSYVTNKF